MIYFDEPAIIFYSIFYSIMSFCSDTIERVRMIDPEDAETYYLEYNRFCSKKNINPPDDLYPFFSSMDQDHVY